MNTPLYLLPRPEYKQTQKPTTPFLKSKGPSLQYFATWPPLGKYSEYGLIESFYPLLKYIEMYAEGRLDVSVNAFQIVGYTPQSGRLRKQPCEFLTGDGRASTYLAEFSASKPARDPSKPGLLWFE